MPFSVLRKIGALIFVALIAANLFGGPAKAQSYVCSFEWGSNLDLGYCGSVVSVSDSEVTVRVDKVKPSSFGMGEGNICSDYVSLDKLRSGRQIVVPRRCIFSNACIRRWGANYDLGFCGDVISGSFTGTNLKLKVTSVKRSNWGMGQGNSCSDYRDLDAIERGNILDVPISCIN